MIHDIQYIEGSVAAPLGFKAAGVKARIRYNKKDLALIVSEVPAAAAGVFTTNKVKAAPVVLSARHIADGRAQAVVVNSGCANACTGEDGMTMAVEMAREAAGYLGINAEDVVVASTGVIGEKLPMDKIKAGISEAASVLSSDGGHDAALAIMTTDTVPKEVLIKLEIGGSVVTIGGIAKGSGMIMPNMATMLAFVTTDAAITPQLLRKSVTYAAERTFNMVTVDGDTSTNDSLIVLANGLAGHSIIEQEDENFFIFRDALERVCKALAMMIARDGEGATKLIEVEVRNAPAFADARKVAMAVANSNLVKTAVFGEDANWGRIICAAGYSGADIDPERIDIFIGDEKMAENGAPLNFSEDRAKEILGCKEVKITLDLHHGSEKATAWTCDFSFDYVKINASYRS
ncbi:bifunctional glutamate N-acetyltransferase/amino-acid acetyltransferase ArgJ [Phosphitispora sp. TUW77]|uniref:bifunctional glutamate N-acetyltransferase/amino-acid acetyltransferase ArgJ n=1 Tax=Phosphitispora sp. TUW77 TaxID=3152361 RepID=UPI003AB37B34